MRHILPMRQSIRYTWDKGLNEDNEVDEDNEGDMQQPIINNQYSDNDKRRLQRGRGKWTSADKEDDKGGWRMRRA